MVGLLTAVSEELQDVPLHYTLPDLAGTLHCTCPKMDQFKVRAYAYAGALPLSDAGLACTARMGSRV